MFYLVSIRHLLKLFLSDERTLTILQNSIADPLIVNSYRFIGRHRHEIDYQISQAALNFLVDEAVSIQHSLFLISSIV